MIKVEFLGQYFRHDLLSCFIRLLLQVNEYMNPAVLKIWLSTEPCVTPRSTCLSVQQIMTTMMKCILYDVTIHSHLFTTST